MRKCLMAMTAVAVLAGSPAFAADMALKAPPLPPPPAELWTGAYIGGFAGGAFGANSVSVGDCFGPTFTCTALGDSATFNLGDSFIGGLTTGAQQQVGHFVFGFEGETGYIHMSGAGSLVGPIQPNVATITFGDWYSTETIRLGVTSGLFNGGADNVLIYGKVGIGYGEFQNTLRYTNNAATAGFLTENLSNSTVLAGGAFGAGVEWKVTPLWSVKGEYEYLAINSSGSACGPVLSPGLGPPIVPTTTVCSQGNMKGFSTVKVGINRSFDLAALLNGLLNH
jgi:outer membrane immunogenic protein